MNNTTETQDQGRKGSVEGNKIEMRNFSSVAGDEKRCILLATMVTFFWQIQ